MNWVDVIIIVILLIGLVKGLANGFVRGLFGVVALILGIMVAAASYQLVAEYMPDVLPFGEQGVAIISFLLVFVVILIIVNIIATIISKALKLASLGWLDRLAGGVLGLLMSCLFVAVLLLLVVMAGFHTNAGIARSQVAPGVIRVVEAVVTLAPQGISEKVDEHFVKLQLEWEKAREQAEKEGEEKKGEEKKGEEEKAEEAAEEMVSSLAPLPLLGPQAYTGNRETVGIGV